MLQYYIWDIILILQSLSLQKVSPASSPFKFGPLPPSPPASRSPSLNRMERITECTENVSSSSSSTETESLGSNQNFTLRRRKAESEAATLKLEKKDQTGPGLTRLEIKKLQRELVRKSPDTSQGQDNVPQQQQPPPQPPPPPPPPPSAPAAPSGAAPVASVSCATLGKRHHNHNLNGKRSNFNIELLHFEIEILGHNRNDDFYFLLFFCRYYNLRTNSAQR